MATTMFVLIYLAIAPLGGSFRALTKSSSEDGRAVLLGEENSSHTDHRLTNTKAFESFQQDFIAKDESVASADRGRGLGREYIHKEHGEIGTHVVILAMCMFLLAGIVVHYFSVRLLPSIPYTCIVFILGAVVSYVDNSFEETFQSKFTKDLSHGIGSLQAIDPHLALLLFLPPLVFAEAMNLNIAMLKTCLWQCMILAVPGVLIGTVLTGTAAYYFMPYQWPLTKAMLFGSILAATDPVAVVAVFNSLGVSPRLTMLISGESLFNDGTAVVLFEFLLALAKGPGSEGSVDTEIYTSVSGALKFIALKLVVGPLLGMVVGVLAVKLIKWTSNGFFDTDSTVQVIITIFCGYTGFVLAEFQMNSSGVLAVVVAGIMLAGKAGPKFVSHETLHEVWHAVEFVGNTLIFVLSGVIFAHAFHPSVTTVPVGYQDWAALGLNYVFAMLIRAAMLAILFYPLNCAGHRISYAEASVMAWGGLRGAVGLLMAVIVTNDSELNMHQVDFQVGGVAALTLLINGTFTPHVLDAVGLMKGSRQQEMLLFDVARHIKERTVAFLEENGNNEVLFPKDTQSQIAKIQSSFCTHVSSHDWNFDISVLKSPFSRPGETDEIKLEMLRGVFLRCLHSVYMHMSHDQIISRRSKVSTILVESTKQAMMNCDNPLADWTIVKDELMIQRFATEEDYSRRFPLIFQRLGFVRDFKRYKEHEVSACIGFIHAHHEAMHLVFEQYGQVNPQDMLELQMVENESKQQVEVVKDILSELDKKLVVSTRQKMFTGMAVQYQIKLVGELEEMGLVTAADSAIILKRIQGTVKTVIGDDEDTDFAPFFSRQASVAHANLLH